mgnify:CR=1 FL=1
MKKLRAYKIFDWFLVALSYLAAILLYNGAVSYGKNPGTVQIMNALRISGLVFYGIVLFLQVIVYIVGIIYGITAKESMGRHNMIIKIVSIPFFIINFIAFSRFAIDSMKIKAWLVFVVAGLSIAGSFSIMFRTSLSNVIYFIRCYIKKTLKVKPWAVVALIFSFIFFLDVIGSIILYKHELNQRPDIAARIKEKRLKKVEKWKTSAHMSLRLYEILTAILTAIITIFSIVIIVTLIYNMRHGILVDVVNLGNVIIGNIFVSSLIIIIIASILKLILGIIYGKLGEKDPINFLFIIKLIDIIPSITSLAITLLLFAGGIVSGVYAIISLSIIPLFFCVFLVTLYFLGTSILSYASASQFMISASLCIFSTSLIVFTYYINQRAVKNRKFLNPLIIVSLICLWIPILDIVAIVILKIKAKNNQIFSDIPVVEA